MGGGWEEEELEGEEHEVNILVLQVSGKYSSFFFNMVNANEVDNVNSCCCYSREFEVSVG